MGNQINTRWLSLKLLDYDQSLIGEVNHYLGADIREDTEVAAVLDEAREYLEQNGIPLEKLKDRIVCALVTEAEEISRGSGALFTEIPIMRPTGKSNRVLTSKWRATRL